MNRQSVLKGFVATFLVSILFCATPPVVFASSHPAPNPVVTFLSVMRDAFMTIGEYAYNEIHLLTSSVSKQSQTGATVLTIPPSPATPVSMTRATSTVVAIPQQHTTTYTAPYVSPASISIQPSTVVTPPTIDLSSYVSKDDLRNTFQNYLANIQTPNFSTGANTPITNVYQQIADTQRIDRLTNTVINAPTISGGSITGTSIIGGASLTSLIAPSTGLTFLQSGTGATSRSVSDKLTESVSVKDFGAVGDCSTDDSAAFSAAWDFVKTTGGKIEVPKTSSCYKFKTPLSLGLNSAHVSIVGDGNPSIVCQASSHFDSCIGFGNINDVEISGLNISGSTTTPTVGRVLVFTPPCSNIYVHDNSISGANVVPSTGALAGLYLGGSCQNVTIENNNFSNNGPASGAALGADIYSANVLSTNIRVLNNRLVGHNVQYSIALFDTQKSEVLGNSIDEGNTGTGNNTGYGIMIYTAGFPSITSASRSSNVVTLTPTSLPGEWVVGETIRVYGVPTGGGGTDFNGDFIITSVNSGAGTVSYAQTAANDTAGSGGTAEGVSPGNVVSNNQVSNAYGSCIYLAGISDSAISNNTLKNCATTQTDASLPVGGLSINGGLRVTVSNTVVNTSGRDGIVTVDLDGSVISNSTITTTGAIGIDLRGTTNNSSVTGAVIKGVEHGVMVAGATTNSHFSDFNISNFTGYGFLASGGASSDNMLTDGTIGSGVGIAAGVFTATNHTRWTISNIKFSSMAGLPIDLRGSDSVISNNYIAASVSGAIQIINSLSSPNFNLVENNTFNGSGQAIINQAKYTIFRNNTFHTSGVDVLDSTDLFNGPTSAYGLIIKSGNVGIGTTTPTLGPLVMSSGAYVTSGGVWTNSSDRNLKENFTPLSSIDILSKINQLPITEWNYKNEDPAIKHIGPVAQDFYSVFGVGNNNTSISTIDPAGIALAGVQAVDSKVEMLASTTAQTTDGLGQPSFIGRFFARLISWFADTTNGIHAFFAEKIFTHQLCISDDMGSTTCLTKADIDSVFNTAHVGGSGSGGGGTSVSTTTSTGPVITVLGSNPATVSVGSSYNDLGATVTDVDSLGNINTNLGLHFEVDGVDVVSISLDTSTTTNYTILYKAFDSDGKWGYATRTVSVVQ